MEPFEHYSVCAEWITVVFWGNSLVKLIIADISQGPAKVFSESKFLNLKNAFVYTDLNDQNL